MVASWTVVPYDLIFPVHFDLHLDPEGLLERKMADVVGSVTRDTTYMTRPPAKETYESSMQAKPVHCLCMGSPKGLRAPSACSSNTTSMHLVNATRTPLLRHLIGLSSSGAIRCVQQQQRLEQKNARWNVWYRKVSNKHCLKQAGRQGNWMWICSGLSCHTFQALNPGIAAVSLVLLNIAPSRGEEPIISFLV